MRKYTVHETLLVKKKKKKNMQTQENNFYPNANGLS